MQDINDNETRNERSVLLFARRSNIFSGTLSDENVDGNTFIAIRQKN